MKSIVFCLTAASSLALTQALRAQTPDTATLNPVVISATKSAVSRANLPQAVTVMTGVELRAKGITRVADALRLVPGAQVVQNGSPGSVTSLFVRGGESRYTKVLIDGVTVNSPGGFFDFSHLTTDNIERIEVVRGPASVVYGADAVAGIVRIFTRQGRGGFKGTAEARAGSYDSREAVLDASGGSTALRYSLGGGLHRTDGILPFNNQYYNGTASASVGVTPVTGTEAVVSARYTDAEFHYPTDFTGAPVDSNSYRVQHRLTVGADASTQLASSLKGKLSLGTNEVSDLTEDIAVPFGETLPQHSADLSRDKRRSAEAGLTFLLPLASTFDVGAEYVNESERSTSSAGPVGGVALPSSRFDAARHNTAVYSELIANSTAGGSLTLAARRDDNSDYDAFNTYRIGLSLPDGLSSRIRASIGTAFNAPAFNQVRPTLFTVGSPDLKPERSRSWEVGAEQTLASGAVRISGSYFNQRFSDLIQFVDGGPPNFLGSFANLAEAQSNGYEGEITVLPIKAWSASASYTVARPHVTRVDPRYTGNLKVGDALLRRPAHSGTATLTWSKPATGSVSLMANYVGPRPDVDFNQFPSPTVTLPSYTKLDAAASRTLFRRSSGLSGLAVTLRVDNVLNRKYQDVLHYPAPPRMLLVGARVNAGL